MIFGYWLLVLDIDYRAVFKFQLCIRGDFVAMKIFIKILRDSREPFRERTHRICTCNVVQLVRTGITAENH